MLHCQLQNTRKNVAHRCSVVGGLLWECSVHVQGEGMQHPGRFFFFCFHLDFLAQIGDIGDKQCAHMDTPSSGISLPCEGAHMGSSRLKLKEEIGSGRPGSGSSSVCTGCLVL